MQVNAQNVAAGIKALQAQAPASRQDLLAFHNMTNAQVNETLNAVQAIQQKPADPATVTGLSTSGVEVSIKMLSEPVLGQQPPWASDWKAVADGPSPTWNTELVWTDGDGKVWPSKVFMFLPYDVNGKDIVETQSPGAFAVANDKFVQDWEWIFSSIQQQLYPGFYQDSPVISATTVAMRAGFLLGAAAARAASVPSKS